MKGARSKILTAAQIDTIARRYTQDSATVEELANEYKCSTAPIRNALKMRHVRMRVGSGRGFHGERALATLNSRIS